ncbi:MAG: hypothetical protein ACYCQJ_10510 [Nitrososphaerales archaeon]
MDRKQLIRQFVKENLSLLTSKTGVKKELLKKYKFDFFIEKFHSAVPKDKEIAEDLVEYLFGINYFSTSGSLEEFLSLPFLKENISAAEPYIQRLEFRSNSQLGIDPRRIREQEYQETIKKALKHEVLVESTKDIEKAIQEKKAEYASYPSILDESDFEEPSVTPPPPEERYNPWWRQLHLKADPFPSTVGLDKIAEGLYEKVVFKTDIFQKYLYYIENERSELFKETIFFGLFGSGKTTLFDYMQRPLIYSRIYPLYIQLYAEQDFQSFLIQFRRKLLQKLEKLYENLYPAHQLNPDTSDLQQGIVTAFQKIKSQFSPVGFIIFVDDLHKNRQKEYFEAAMEFLNNLQIFKSELSRALPNIEVAFFIAGSIEWQREISSDPKYSGSYSRTEIMPPITEEIALEMLNRRLNAFSMNPDNVSAGGGVTLDFVKKIYRGLSNDNVPITFREFIKATLKEFEKGNFTVLNADPFHLSDERLSEIRDALETDNDLASRISKLIFGGGIQKEDARAKCLEVLITCYLEKGIQESREATSYFFNNRFFFQRLARAGLIEKKRTGPGQFAWIVCKPLYDKNKEILSRYKVSMEDYLLKIYKLTVKPKKELNVQRNELEALDKFASLISSESVKQLLADAKKEYLSVSSLRQRVDTQASPEEIIGHCISAMCSLTNAVSVYLKASRKIEREEDVFEFWSDFWRPPSEMLEFLNLLLDSRDYEERVWFICNLFQGAFISVLEFLEEEESKSRYFPIPVTELTNSEIDEFHTLRDLWLEKKYMEVVERIGKMVDPKLRLFLFNIYRLRYGEDIISRLGQVDSQTRNYVNKNIQSAISQNIPVSKNEFEQVNRGNYKNFLIGLFDKDVGKRNWENLFHAVFAPWSETEIRDFLSAFADWDIATTHRKSGSIVPEQQSQIYDYTIKAITFLRAINRAYLKILNDGVRVVDTGSQPKYAHYVTLNGKDLQSLKPIFIPQNEAWRIEETLRKKSVLNLDLSDYEMIETYFNISYPHFFIFLSRSIALSKKDVSDKIPVRIQVTNEHGCNVTVQLNDVEQITTRN